MNKYELAVVVNANIEDEERAAVVDKCKALIERFGGQITNIDEWGKKRLAYDIQKMREAFYYFIQFDAEATAPAEIEQRMRIMDNVLRYLCVRQDEA
ncbi:MAG: 30S ribosomal protein S6 [Lachnospiraceae bacterium]|nr:30S ribosomal protein S6 [Candidatus Colinaster equi]